MAVEISKKKKGKKARQQERCCVLKSEMSLGEEEKKA